MFMTGVLCTVCGAQVYLNNNVERFAIDSATLLTQILVTNTESLPLVGQTLFKD